MSLTARPYLQKHAGGQRYKWVIKLAVHKNKKIIKLTMVIAQKSFVHNFSFILNDPFRWRTQATLSSTEHLSGASKCDVFDRIAV
ncbi:hypothetical protein SEEH3343_16913 [Salmonella enterica subsp. enterica serovar Heidelberg str. RI-11-013343]|nr:hypothetical protein SEEH4403_11377 [Salmonella enterica subsp. enterica serovar Heidelberg str. N4403]KJT53224.1 hypothetical protein SEEH3343_16913 [Salmonella enterica subsp. enterica serovar Heidelberg str. RI-11-013343]KJT76432.1 hypothetical protein SEEH3714_00500 [Salmonella enterica subsp. enterica serovar Heidelberg str. 622737-14]KJT94983.1 hypothetical protein SEEH0300_04094 [Salmonella enterica subsp. enterica serovar Heidelberg str. 76-0300]